MEKIRIFKNTCTKSFMADEQGTGFSLEPWGDNTSYYEGHDDGGKMYALPEGYYTAECNGGTLEVYDPNNNHCTIFGNAGAPSLVLSSGEILPLERA